MVRRCKLSRGQRTVCGPLLHTQLDYLRYLNIPKACTPHIQELLLPVHRYPTVSILIILMFCRQLHHVERTLVSQIRKLFNTDVCPFWVILCKTYVKL